MPLTTFRVRLRVRSALGSPLQADTLWGHIAWGIRYADGEAALRTWLARYDENDPPLVVADPCPVGFLPRPALPSRAVATETATGAAAFPALAAVTGAWKRMGRTQWLSHESFSLAQAYGFDASGLRKALQQDMATGRSPGEFVETSVTRASINRLTGGTVQSGGGTLFTAAEWHPPASGLVSDLWVLADGDAEEVRRLLLQGLAGGYGRDAASGKGQVDVEAVERCSLPTAPDGGNAMMLLAAAAPASTDPFRGFGRLTTRAGRLGGDYAVGATPDGQVLRQKRPVTMLERGSVLVGAPQPFVGRLVGGVHSFAPIRHYGMAVCLPVRLSETLASEAA
jgi:CRISPR-associated protein Csm4